MALEKKQTDKAQTGDETNETSIVEWDETFGSEHKDVSPEDKALAAMEKGLSVDEIDAAIEAERKKRLDRAIRPYMLTYRPEPMAKEVSKEKGACEEAQRAQECAEEMTAHIASETEHSSPQPTSEEKLNCNEDEDIPMDCDTAEDDDNPMHDSGPQTGAAGDSSVNNPTPDASTAKATEAELAERKAALLAKYAEVLNSPEEERQRLLSTVAGKNLTRMVQLSEKKAPNRLAGEARFIKAYRDLDPDQEGLDLNADVTIDMILLVVGMFYGQRDLLSARADWN